MSTPDTRFDVVRQYVDWGDHTVVVEPNRGPWIHEGGDTKHADQNDRDDERHGAALALVTLQGQQSTPQPYKPSASFLNSLPGFNSRETMSTIRGPVRGVGERPVIDSLLRRVSDNLGHGTIERLQYQERHAIAARVFDRSD